MTVKLTKFISISPNKSFLSSLGLLVAVAIVTSGRPAVSAGLGVLVDNFNEPADGSHFVLINRFSPSFFLESPQSSGLPFNSVLGGYRDLEIININSSNASPAVSAFGSVFNGQVDWSNPVNFDSQLKITWDGQDNSPDIDFDGLGGVDLTPTPLEEGFLLQLTNDLAGFDIKIDVYTDAMNFSSSTININTANPGTGNPVNVFSSFVDDFTIAGGTGADFSNVGAVQITLDGPQDIDATIRLVETGPDPDGQPEIPEPSSVLSLIAVTVFGGLMKYINR